MKYGLYCIRDDKVGFLAPAIDYNDASAMRNFREVINDGDFAKHRHDLSFYRVGEFDTLSGNLSTIDAPVYLCSGSDFSDNGGV